ncbi:hypothetical protein QBE54_11090 [Thermatribacter velox]|uniref:Integrase catalytic domain-containing protein n=1 Tax=Thermatribacter velox TaxID=3039681 RepID=A0ABZ2YD69_9BACT
MKYYSVTEVEMKRYAVLQNVVSGLITLKAAAELLGLSYCQTLRLKKCFVAQRLEGLLRKAPSHPPHWRVTPKLKEQILQLRKELYYDFNLLHFREKLSENHCIALSYETLRKNYLVQRGIFMALYTDRASHFTTTRHGGLHYDTLSEYGNTQIQRALEELGIARVSASNPQAKGRIERAFRFFQGRLIKELRLRGIKDYEATNRFLEEEFLPWCNQRYTLSVESVYREIPKGVDLSLIFSIKQRRKVRKDNTISYEGRIYQLLPACSFRSYAGSWIEVREILKGNIQLFYQGESTPYQVFDKQTHKQLKEEVLSMRSLLPEKKPKKKYIPPQDHPWRRSWKKKSVTFQAGE